MEADFLDAVFVRRWALDFLYETGACRGEIEDAERDLVFAELDLEAYRKEVRRDH